MTRILYLIDYLYSDRGGTERHLLTLLNRLDRRRFDPYLVCLRSTPWYEQADLPCPSEVLGFRSLIGPDFLRSGQKLVSICKARQIDVVQTFFMDANILGIPWAKRAGVPVRIASRRSLGAGYFYDRFTYRAAFRLLAPHTTHYLTNSSAAARDITSREGVNPERISVISNGLDARDFDPIAPQEIARIRASWGVSPEAFVIGAVATLRPVKNLQAFVEVAASIHTRHPGAQFVILGEGPEKPSLEQLIEARGLKGHFFLPGPSVMAPRDVQAFDIGILVSHSESSPNAVLEYMAAGRPSVVVNVGGIGELVEPGRTAFMYEKDVLEQCGSALELLIEDEALRQRMGREAREHALRKFDWSVILPALESLYAGLAEKSGNGSRDPESR